VDPPSPGPDNTPGTNDDDYGDLRLRSGSPCADSGNNAAVPAGVLTDIMGNPRFSDDPLAPNGAGVPPIVDMGAFEWALDCNGNGVPDDEDIANLTSNDCNVNGLPDECELAGNDCNANGVLDSCDLANLTSTDCTSNGIPDECEVDCNQNGVADSCDIQAGTSQDCNANGIPDECELTGNDCNANGVLDSCDIAAGTSSDCPGAPNGIPDECELMTADCNSNGVADSCDIDAGTSADCNADGVPDSCQVIGNDCNSNSVPDDCEMAPIIYVDADAPAGGNGLHWNTAYKNLQDAYPDPQCTIVTEIHVGQGTYTPGLTRENTFQLVSGVRIKGGYAGFGSPNPEVRDVVAYESVLSGDIGTLGDESDNSYHVMTVGSDVDATAVLDGFTITLGNADGSIPDTFGGGMYVDGGSPTLVGCRFVRNRASRSGGAIYGMGGTPTVINCVFDGNTTQVSDGGAVYNSQNNAVFTNCSFSGNKAGGDGGAMANADSSPELTNCTFSGNTDRGSGPIYLWRSGHTVLTSCIVWGNTPQAIVLNGGATSAISYSDIQGGIPLTGTVDGGGNLDVDPKFERIPDRGADGTWGTADDDYGDFRINAVSLCIDGGSNAALPPDTADLDGDGDTGETLPIDLGGTIRVLDGDSDGTAVVDMGAYEFDGLAVPVADPLVATGEAAKPSRYLRFSAPGGPEATGQVIRVRVITLDGFAVPSPDVFYLGPPSQEPEEDVTDPSRTITAAPFQCTPYSHDWVFEGVISAYGAEIIPESVYEVQRSFGGCPNLTTDEDCWSTAITVITGTWGDVRPPFAGEGTVAAQPDFNDIAAVVQKFTGAPTAPIKPVAQLQPNVVFPDRSIDFKDIATAVTSFLGTPYGVINHGPCSCPSSVACGAAVCTSDTGCGGGYCIGGFCRDACGRCEP